MFDADDVRCRLSLSLTLSLSCATRFKVGKSHFHSRGLKKFDEEGGGREEDVVGRKKKGENFKM